MPPWGAGSKPKKTPANTVRNSTYSTSNRFGGPPSVSGRMGPQSGPPGSGRASQISRPAMAAAAVAKRPNYGPPGTRAPGGPPGTGSPSQIRRPSVPSQADLSAQRYTAAAKAYQDPATGYAQSQVAAPSPNELAGMRYQQAAKTYTEDPGAYQQMLNAPSFGSPGAMGWQPSQQELMRAATSGAATHPAAQRVQQAAPQRAAPSFSQEELMRAATSGAATHPAAQAVQQPAPYAGIDVTSRANSNARMVLPSADEQRAAIAAGGTAYDPAQTARIAEIRNNEAAAYQGPGPSADMLVQGSQGAQEWASNAAAAAPVPAWDPANNDAPITGPVGMWTDPTSGGQMPDPADAEAWERMQRVADSEFGPGQDIYNPEYDAGRFPTYDPSFGGGGGFGFGDQGGGGGFGGGGAGGGAGAGSGTFDPNSGEYLQFGGDLAYNEYQRGAIDEGDAFWDQAHQRKWDETNRGIPGIFNSRGMLDSGLLGRAQGFSAADQNYEQSVQDWQVANQKAALDAEQAALEQQWTNSQSMNLFGNYAGGR